MPSKKNSYVIRDNQIQEVPDNEVDFELLSPARLVGTHANVVPLSNNAQSARLFYASRFVNQSMPEKNRETPWVQTLDPESPDGLSFEEQYGRRMGAQFADNDGTVSAVNKDDIELTYADGTKRSFPIYNNFQFNRKTFLHAKPQVKVGDSVKKGQILASTNFTDDKGTMAMGINARVAMVPYKGYSMDDAIVVSESFAKRMTSEHNYEFDSDKTGDAKYGKVHFTSLFPTAFTQKQLETLDDNGVVKPGTVLHKGDPIILSTKPKPFSSNSTHLGKLSRQMRTMRVNTAEVWEHDYPGVVQDSIDGKKRYKVFASAEVPLNVGDKIVIRNGQKDIVSKILPDEHMLRSVDGNPFEVLLNPLALPSRVNTATSFELALGKLAQAEGKPIKVPSFNSSGKSRLQEVLERLQKAGMSDTEEVFDPETNRKLEKPVATGIAYIYKLHHVVESKKSARGQGAYDCYSADTEVFTRRGWVKWPEVNADDEFYTLDWNCRPLFEKAVRLVSYECNDALYGIRSANVDLLVTKNHTHAVVRKGKLHGELTDLVCEEAAAKLHKRKSKKLSFLTTYTPGKMGAPTDVVLPEENIEYYTQPYNGKVYCATLEPNGLLLVRRNGKVCWSHNSDGQPLKGGTDAAQAKRLGGLETTALMARGAYETLREASTLRGAKNDQYWSLLRQGYKPADPGSPFVWDKFRVLLNGAGMHARDLGKGRLRLSPFTDRDLDEKKPVEVLNGKMVDPESLASAPGGLFMEELVSGNRWGKITLPTALPNPAFEQQIQTLLGITNADMRKVIAGEMTLKEAQEKKKK